MFTRSKAPTVSYYGPLLSSSGAGDSIQRENGQLYTSLRLVLPLRGAWHGYLRVAPSLASHPFLPRVKIITNNNRGVPPRYRAAITIAVGQDRDCYAQLKQLLPAAIPREENFQINLGPKELTCASIADVGSGMIDY